MTELLGTADTSKAGATPFELPGYSNIRQIGAGGMAIVYSAIQQSFNRKVAIKVLMPSFTADTEFADRFLREAQIVSSLSHPHIVPVYDFGQRDGTFYIVMEHLPGGDLAKKIPKGVSEDDALQIASDVASALHFAHAKGFIHRDVKPDNVMFREDNSAVLTDFGIARKQNANTQMTRAGQTVGTPKYMSPQQLQGRAVDGRSDIYSLGIMFYEMLVKQAPYQDEDFMALAMKHLQAPIPKLPQKYARFQKLFERMVAKEPEKRFQSGQEIVSIIQEIRSGKVDAASIDSGEAAELKKAVVAAADRKVAGDAGAATAGAQGAVSRQQMIALQDIDPLLDSDWLKIVSSTFNKLPPRERKFIYESFLQPKGIFLDPQKKAFVFKGRLTVQEVAASVITNTELKAIAGKLMKAEQIIRTTRDVNVVSDTIESGLSIIGRFDAQENLASQKEKLILRAAFLDDVVKLIRESTFDLPASRRLMTVDIVKTYIIQVYLRHEMMGYRFKTLPANELDNDADNFLKEFVAKEVRVRQCDVVRSDGHLFLIGPVKNAGQNPYSIRRFLTEDVTAGGQVVYFSAIAFPLSQLADPKFQEGVRWMVSRIVTLERQLSPGIVDLVQAMDDSRKRQLAPLLLKSLTADGTEIETAIAKRMADYERMLCLMVLGKIPKAISTMTKTNDDLEFLFFNLRRILIELACDIRDFAGQSVAALSDRAEEMDYKMMSYLKLIDKRKPSLFVLGRSKQADPTLDPAFPLAELKKIINEHVAEIDGINTKLRQLVADVEKPRGAFARLLANMFGAEKKKLTIEDLQNQIVGVKRKCLAAAIRMRKRYPMVTVYLEFEDIIPVDEKVRHYAFPAGIDGIGRLPVLVEFPEQAEALDLDAIDKALEESAFT